MHDIRSGANGTSLCLVCQALLGLGWLGKGTGVPMDTTMSQNASLHAVLHNAVPLWFVVKCVVCGEVW